jgi:hypothetical protein
MIPLFDYGDIKDEHKSAAEECAKLVESLNPLVASLIREKFKIVEPKRLPIEESEFYKISTDFGLSVAPQGYMVGPDGIQIPMVAICAEITKFDQFLEYYKNLLCNK